MAKYWELTFGGLMVLLLPAFCPSLFAPLDHASPSIFSEWNAIKPRHPTLLMGALRREIPDKEKSQLWLPLAPQGWKQCADAENGAALPTKSTGYIQVFLDGGLNQQRMGICDAVAVAKFLNATLVIPHLEVNPVWKDSSTFEEIYDVGRFIDVLKNEITIARALPDEYAWSTREYYAVAIRATRVKTAPVHASANWYLENVIPMLQRRKMTTTKIIGAIAGSFAIAYMCDTVISDGKIFGGSTPKTIIEKEWWEETDKKYQKWHPLMIDGLS